MGLRQSINYLIVFFISLSLFYFWQFQSPFLPENDGYYHIAIANLMRTEGFIRQFRWAELSLWFKNFSDKEFLFHVYLMPFTWIFENLHTAAKVATVILAACGITSFFGIIRLNKLRASWFWTLMLMSSGGYFLYRANVPRPQVLSIILCLWAIHFIINNQRKHLAILCFIYTSAYTGYILPLIFTLIASAYIWFFENELEWKTPATVFGATLTGMIFHPYFPDNWTMFWVQNFYVLWMGTNGKVDLKMGGEFKPMDTKKLFEVLTSVWMSYFAAFFASIYTPVKTDRKTRILFFISLALIILTMTSKRFAEYSVPVTLWFCASFFSPIIGSFDWNKFRRKNFPRFIIVACGGSVLLVALFLRSSWDVARQYHARESRFKEAALWVKDHVPKGQLVYTCDWDDTPEIFFYNQNNSYPVFLDPNFMYYWNPKMWETWFRVSNGMERDRTYYFLKEVFNVQYGICTRDFGGLREIMLKDNRFEIVLTTPHTYVFKLR
ncbi:MAG: hypothetical protein KA116_11645 [Proteobacteria bacterium]|nr:hypothetical protein [Pseudomonadota bacterium]